MDYGNRGPAILRNVLKRWGVMATTEPIKVTENDGVLSVVINFAGYIMAIRPSSRLS